MDLWRYRGRHLKPTKRQLMKQQNSHLAELFFVIEWEDEDSISVIQAKDLVIQKDAGSLGQGDKVQCRCGGKLYWGTIVASGSEEQMKKTQDEMEQSEPEDETGNEQMQETQDDMEQSKPEDETALLDAASNSVTDVTTDARIVDDSCHSEKVKGKKKSSPKKGEAHTGEKSASKRKKLSKDKNSATKRSTPRKKRPCSEAKDAHKATLYAKKQKQSAKQLTASEASAELFAMLPNPSTLDLSPPPPAENQMVEPEKTLFYPPVRENEPSVNVSPQPAIGRANLTPTSECVTPPLRKAISDESYFSYGKQESNNSQPLQFSVPHYPRSAGNYYMPDYPSCGPFRFNRSPTPMSEISSASLFETDNAIMGSILNLREEMSNFKTEMRNEMALLKVEVGRKSRKVHATKPKMEPQPPPSPKEEGGCWFGPAEKGVFLPGIDSSQLAAADAHDDAGRLSQELAVLLFTKEELASGCATKPRKPGIQQLDTKRLHAIRVHVAHRFPVGNGLFSPEESKRWKELKSKKINVRARQFRGDLEDPNPQP